MAANFGSDEEFSRLAGELGLNIICQGLATMAGERAERAGGLFQCAQRQSHFLKHSRDLRDPKTRREF
jgi:hypothetical protein